MKPYKLARIAGVSPLDVSRWVVKLAMPVTQTGAGWDVDAQAVRRWAETCPFTPLLPLDARLRILESIPELPCVDQKPPLS